MGLFVIPFFLHSNGKYSVYHVLEHSQLLHDLECPKEIRLASKYRWIYVYVASHDLITRTASLHRLYVLFPLTFWTF